MGRFNDSILLSSRQRVMYVFLLLLVPDHQAEDLSGLRASALVKLWHSAEENTWDREEGKKLAHSMGLQSSPGAEKPCHLALRPLL